MDAIDILLVDHLIQNIDRHAFYFEPTLYSSLLLMDNGKGFVLKRSRFFFATITIRVTRSFKATTSYNFEY